ncbi:hypothetical protein ACOMHN_064431 [Nucella lapillus]
MPLFCASTAARDECCCSPNWPKAYQMDGKVEPRKCNESCVGAAVQVGEWDNTQCVGYMYIKGKYMKTFTMWDTHYNQIFELPDSIEQFEHDNPNRTKKGGRRRRRTASRLQMNTTTSRIWDGTLPFNTTTQNLSESTLLMNTATQKLSSESTQPKGNHSDLQGNTTSSASLDRSVLGSGDGKGASQAQDTLHEIRVGRMRIVRMNLTKCMMMIRNPPKQSPKMSITEVSDVHVKNVVSGNPVFYHVLKNNPSSMNVEKMHEKALKMIINSSLVPQNDKIDHLPQENSSIKTHTHQTSHITEINMSSQQLKSKNIGVKQEKPNNMSKEDTTRQSFVNKIALKTHLDSVPTPKTSTHSKMEKINNGKNPKTHLNKPSLNARNKDKAAKRNIIRFSKKKETMPLFFKKEKDVDKTGQLAVPGHQKLKKTEDGGKTGKTIVPGHYKLKKTEDGGKTGKTIVPGHYKLKKIEDWGKTGKTIVPGHYKLKKIEDWGKTGKTIVPGHYKLKKIEDWGKTGKTIVPGHQTLKKIEDGGKTGKTIVPGHYKLKKIEDGGKTIVPGHQKLKKIEDGGKTGKTIVPGHYKLKKIEDWGKTGNTIVPGHQKLKKIEDWGKTGNTIVPGHQKLKKIEDEGKTGKTIVPGHYKLKKIEDWGKTGNTIVPGHQKLKKIEDEGKTGNTIVPGHQKLKKIEDEGKTGKTIVPGHYKLKKIEDGGKTGKTIVPGHYKLKKIEDGGKTIVPEHQKLKGIKELGKTGKTTFPGHQKLKAAISGHQTLKITEDVGKTTLPGHQEVKRLRKRAAARWERQSGAGEGMPELQGRMEDDPGQRRGQKRKQKPIVEPENTGVLVMDIPDTEEESTSVATTLMGVMACLFVLVAISVVLFKKKREIMAMAESKGLMSFIQVLSADSKDELPWRT